jgi:molybdopterin molybdotransferase
MVSVQEATSIVLSNLYQPVVEKINAMDATGKVLAEEIIADRDFPPYNRVSMDGIAFLHSQWKTGKKEFLIEDIQTAGEPQKKLKATENCLEVMTGAILPENTDTVVRYEDVMIKNKQALILSESIKQGQNIHYQGLDAKFSTVLLTPGIVISPAEIALLASVGKTMVDVLSYPSVAIVANGDELVDITETPKPYQIRRSNSYALRAALMQMGISSNQFHLPDQQSVLEESLRTILNNHDVVILSGGVSKGKLDYIPEVLTQIGVKKLFHQVSQRPGKPFWFGIAGKNKVVFALPGNPVSTFMCFYRYVKPWILRSLGLRLPATTAILSTDFTFDNRLTYFLQVQIQNREGKLIASPVVGGGSGDFANLKDVDGFLELPLEKSTFKEGEVFPFIPFRGLEI